MIRRFERDDDGYVAWLAAHPSGFVLNTCMHVTSDYLVLHRARCRTVNRPLAPSRSWTHAYGKTCSDTREELDAWALQRAGKPNQPCGICRPGGGSFSGIASAKPRGGGAAGPRAPRRGDTVQMAGDGITINVDPMPSGTADPPRLVIEGAQWLAETFFRFDASAVGPMSFDAHVRRCQADTVLRDRVVEGDVRAVNSSMAARTSLGTWRPIIEASEWAWLTDLDAEWDLVDMGDDEWATHNVSGRLHAAFSAAQRPGLQAAVVTKVLHIKRPRLIPVLDSLVMDQIAGRTTGDVLSWVTAVEHLRHIGRQNLIGMRSIDEHLRERGIADRSLARILDSLLWSSAPGSALSRELSGWERVFRPQ